MMPYIGKVMQLAAPQHSWSYDRLLELFYNGDLDDDECAGVSTSEHETNLDETTPHTLNSKDAIEVGEAEGIQEEANDQGDREEGLQGSLATKFSAPAENLLPKR